MIKSITLFILAGLFEIGGGYLVWQWWRNGRGFLLGALGGLILFLYGVIPTYQTENFGRVYAADAKRMGNSRGRAGGISAGTGGAAGGSQRFGNGLSAASCLDPGGLGEFFVRVAALEA